MAVPFALATVKAAFLQLLPTPLLTVDQVRLLKSDTVVAEDALGLADLGIRPTPVDGVLPTYMHRHRRGGLRTKLATN